MINPDSGPGSSKDDDYVTIIQNSQSVGLKVIGYVATGYAGNDPNTITGQIDDYYSWYPNIDGIFLDEVSTSCSDALNFYQPIYAYIKSKQGSTIVTINPGTNVPECFVNCSTIIVTFESPLSDYNDYQVSEWNARYPREKFYHIIYNVPLEKLNATYQKTQENYAGYVYITDKAGGNPYNSNPSYLLAELSLLNPENTTTESTTSTSSSSTTATITITTGSTSASTSTTSSNSVDDSTSTLTQSSSTTISLISTTTLSNSGVSSHCSIPTFQFFAVLVSVLLSLSVSLY
eukprot:TRINITY_DN5410_c0_g1_i2.p1 TRINITY_DN5410_c0_g1~~TRINITY_DN5410_c0_g1_i2.p1  ORF type:complete len:290 (-),score=49.47 TRINITY_DN5410_c0_g1_i2:76-945(-)